MKNANVLTVEAIERLIAGDGAARGVGRVSDKKLKDRLRQYASEHAAEIATAASVDASDETDQPKLEAGVVYGVSLVNRCSRDQLNAIHAAFQDWLHGPDEFRRGVENKKRLVAAYQFIGALEASNGRSFVMGIERVCSAATSAIEYVEWQFDEWEKVVDYYDEQELEGYPDWPEFKQKVLENVAISLPTIS